MFSLICTRINGWVNSGEAGDLGRYRAHYDLIVMNELRTYKHIHLIPQFHDLTLNNIDIITMITTKTNNKTPCLWFMTSHLIQFDVLGSISGGEPPNLSQKAALLWILDSTFEVSAHKIPCPGSMDVYETLPTQVRYATKNRNTIDKKYPSCGKYFDDTCFVEALCVNKWYLPINSHLRNGKMNFPILARMFTTTNKTELTITFYVISGNRSYCRINASLGLLALIKFVKESPRNLPNVSNKAITSWTLVSVYCVSRIMTNAMC